jgi:hypothetical protein
VCAGYTLLANSQQQQPRMKLARSVQDSSTVIRPWM